MIFLDIYFWCFTFNHLKKIQSSAFNYIKQAATKCPSSMLLHDFKNRLDLAVSSFDSSASNMQLLLNGYRMRERECRLQVRWKKLQRRECPQKEKKQGRCQTRYVVHMTILSFFSIFPISENFSQLLCYMTIATCNSLMGCHGFFSTMEKISGICICKEREMFFFSSTYATPSTPFKSWALLQLSVAHPKKYCRRMNLMVTI